MSLSEIGQEGVAAVFWFEHAWLPLKKNPGYSELQKFTGGVGRTLTNRMFSSSLSLRQTVRPGQYRGISLHPVAVAPGWVPEVMVSVDHVHKACVGPASQFVVRLARCPEQLRRYPKL